MTFHRDSSPRFASNPYRRPPEVNGEDYFNLTRSDTSRPLITEIERLRRELLDAHLDCSALQISSQHSREIGVAIGIVMTTYRTGAERAYAMLHEAALNTRRAVHEVAAGVVHDGTLAATA